MISTAEGVRTPRPGPLRPGGLIRWRLWLLPASLLAGIGLWLLILRVGGYQPFILPPPGAVWDRFLRAA
ncbi:MAG: taurine ABC transporter permease, partial [Chloroflexi bacterium]|nr:taurine ABC transporter permease [Chloroflexota bacterium]